MTARFRASLTQTTSKQTLRRKPAKFIPRFISERKYTGGKAKQCVRVDIKHNGRGPHFGGAAWVRRGSTSVPATEALYQQLLELRSSKVHELTKWVGKKVIVSWSAAVLQVYVDPEMKTRPPQGW